MGGDFQVCNEVEDQSSDVVAALPVLMSCFLPCVYPLSPAFSKSRIYLFHVLYVPRVFEDTATKKEKICVLLLKRQI